MALDLDFCGDDSHNSLAATTNLCDDLFARGMLAHVLKDANPLSDSQWGILLPPRHDACGMSWGEEAIILSPHLAAICARIQASPQSGQVRARLAHVILLLRVPICGKPWDKLELAPVNTATALGVSMAKCVLG